MPTVALLLIVAKFAWLVSAGLLWLLLDLEAWAEGDE